MRQLSQRNQRTIMVILHNLIKHFPVATTGSISMKFTTHRATLTVILYVWCVQTLALSLSVIVISAIFHVYVMAEFTCSKGDTITAKLTADSKPRPMVFYLFYFVTISRSRFLVELLPNAKASLTPGFYFRYRERHLTKNSWHIPIRPPSFPVYVLCKQMP